MTYMSDPLGQLGGWNHSYLFENWVFHFSFFLAKVAVQYLAPYYVVCVLIYVVWICGHMRELRRARSS
jgi:hypothetical protein